MTKRKVKSILTPEQEDLGSALIVATVKKGLDCSLVLPLHTTTDSAHRLAEAGMITGRYRDLIVNGLRGISVEHDGLIEKEREG